MKKGELLTQEELGKVVAEVSQKAAVDADFRQKFITDAKSVIGEITGKKLSDDTVIDVVESSPDVLATYVVPALNPNAQAQLPPLVLSDNPEWTAEDYAATVKHVLTKAGIDANFRQVFLATPYAVVEKEAGKKIADGFRFDVREARPEAALTFALPKYVGENGLTDEELLLIAAAGNSGKRTGAILGGIGVGLCLGAIAAVNALGAVATGGTSLAATVPLSCALTGALIGTAGTVTIAGIVTMACN